jgi:hypothetical protein
VHGHGALSATAVLPEQTGARDRRAAFKAGVVGVVLQTLGTALVHAIPPLLTGKFYPVLATFTAGFTGFLFARAARGASLRRQLLGGALAAGAGGVAGAGLFVLLGDLPLELLPVAVISCSVTGALGAPLGRIRRHRP